MLRTLAALCCALLAGAPSPAQASPGKGEWIWRSSAPRDGDVVYFRRTVELPAKPAAARWTLACDNRFVAWVNGERAGSGDDWTSAVDLDVAELLVAGTNLLAVRGHNEGGPAALLAELTVELDRAPDVAVVTDRSWKCADSASSGWRGADFDDSGWVDAHSFGTRDRPGLPWQDPLAPRPTTEAADLTVAAGFEVERLCTARRGEGSWVCLTFDPVGRLIVSPQNGPLLRVTIDTEQDSARVEKLGVDIGHAQGLLCAFDSLYVVVSRKGQSSLHRLRDTDGDDRYDEDVELKSFSASGEHGPHAVVAGPDGKLYVVIGNYNDMPDGVDPSSPLRNWGEDLLSKRMWDPRGHAHDRFAPGAIVLRTDPDGQHWEVIAGGMRNPYDLAFDARGELFTYDADMEWDIASPWYRPTRMLHVISGGEYGWRAGSAKWPAHYPDSLPAVVDVGLGSPTGMASGHHSSFPEPHRDRIYLGDWALGRINAVELNPEGASYRGEVSEFLTGRPFNVTDFEFGPDGAMYAITGGRGTQSALYRVSWKGPDGDRSAVQTALPPEVVLRRELEALHTTSDREGLELAWPHLGHADRFVRFAARIAIENRDLSTWRERALAEKRVAAAPTALLAVARHIDRGSFSRLIDRVAEFDLATLDRATRLDLVRVLTVACARIGEVDAAAAQTIVSLLDPLYPAGTDSESRELCRLLVHLGAPRVVERTLYLMATARTPTEQMFYAFQLRRTAEGWTRETRAQYFSWFDRAREHPGGMSFRGYVDGVREQAESLLTESERAELEAVLATEPEPGARSAPGTLVRAWTIDDLTPLLHRVGSERSFESGAKAFETALCATCHRVAGRGGVVGPDLTHAARRFSRRDLLEATLLPSKTIPDQYVNALIETRGGETLVGRIVAEDADWLTVETDPVAGTRRRLARGTVLRRKTADISPMPPDLVNTLTAEQILDLLAYVEAGGDPQSPQFR